MEDLCELKTKDGWARLDIHQALALNPELSKRCPECHGAVRAHKASNNGMRAHFEHIISHAGCSLKPKTFSGIKSMHPDALA
jgi:hypothetical protein